MTEALNAGDALGPEVRGWTPRPLPPATPMEGRYARLEPFSAERHARRLYEALSEDVDGRLWAYMISGPFADFAAFDVHARGLMSGANPLFHTIVDKIHDAPLGVAALMHVTPEHGVVEVGHVAYAPALQRKRAATEAMFLLMCRVFDELGYRRYEWKCNDRNEASKSAALRLGFRFEGVFRNHMVVKGRSRDSAWFSITDAEWPARKAAFEAWLDPANFDEKGGQKRRLSDLNLKANSK
ncbi:MAG: GNAT family N-acetyltransferase [Bauldia sp.]